MNNKMTEDKYYIRGYAQGVADLKQKLLTEYTETLAEEEQSWSNINHEAGNNQGWVEAVRYAISQLHFHTKEQDDNNSWKELPEVATQKLDRLAMIIYREDGYKMHSGGYATWDVVDVEEGDSAGWRVFEVEVRGGMQSDAQNISNSWKYYLHEKYEVNEDNAEFKRWVIVGAGNQILDWSTLNG